MEIFNSIVISEFLEQQIAFLPMDYQNEEKH